MECEDCRTPGQFVLRDSVQFRLELPDVVVLVLVVSLSLSVYLCC